MFLRPICHLGWVEIRLSELVREGLARQCYPKTALFEPRPRKYPAAVLPGANRVFVQPPPDSAVADARHQTRALRVSRHISHAESRQWQAQGRRALTRQRLDLNRELWGEKPEGVPGGLALRGPPFVP